MEKQEEEGGSHRSSASSLSVTEATIIQNTGKEMLATGDVQNDGSVEPIDSQPTQETGENNLKDIEKQAIQTAKVAKNNDDEPVFSVYSIPEKKFLVFLASLAAIFSPMTTNIYFPALNVIAKDLHVSTSLINLTVTTFLILQGIAPTFVGSFSDEFGRRPMYLACFTIYIGANIGLALQSKYAALMVLRCIQACGSSGTIALANAVVADIVTSSERGTYIGYAQAGALLGPSIGPIIGGVLSQYLGWRAIFWFLTIATGVVGLVFLVAFPETCRRVVGNGSLPAQSWNISLLSYWRLRSQRKKGVVPRYDTKGGVRRRPNPLNAVRIAFSKESGSVLLFAGLTFAGLYMILTSLPSQLQTVYGYDSLKIGLCYIPFGVASMGAALFVGRFMDWNFRRHAKKLGMEISKQRQQDLTNFPIEQARLECALPFVVSMIIFAIVYGWVLGSRTSVAGPIVILFFLTFSISGSFQIASALVVDLNRDSAATATASMNLSRCLLGAGGTAFVNPLIEVIGIGWTCTFVAAIWFLFTPLLFVAVKYGPRWRKEKIEAQKQLNSAR